MKRPELLAPAGCKEAFYAAIEAGCDAVYIGGHSFGARAFASNFSDEEIVECIRYAHLYGVKVYVTVNTIVYENEVESFLKYISFLHQNNVDAIIIQDLGMFDLVRRVYPNLELHASTQMHVHNLNGVKLLEKLGVKRVVLARETGFETLKEIRKNTNLELEIFVHGALCISYSGQCLMSSLIGKRSGNRGMCAGTCRQRYNLIDETGKKYNENEYLLSTKDLNVLENIGKLIELGIDSFKIEGRMKRPEYVYLVTKIYRKAIDNYLRYGETLITDEDILELKKIYNRDFTLGYLFSNDIINQYRPNHLGIKIGKVIDINKNKVFIKLEDNLSNGDGIRILNKNEDIGLTITEMFIGNNKVKNAYKKDVITLKNISFNINDVVVKTTDKKQLDEINRQILLKSRKREITGKVIVKVNNNLEMLVSDGKIDVSYKSDYIVEKGLTKPLTKELIEKQITKTNDTPYIFKSLETETDNVSFVPNSKLNELRRNALDLLSEKRLEKKEYKEGNYSIELPDFRETKEINILLRNKETYDKIKNKSFHNLYLLEKEFNEINDDRKVLKLERVINENKVYECPALVSELGSIKKGCYTDFSFNVVNSYTVAFLHSLGAERITLSHELDDEQIKLLTSEYRNRYGKEPNLELIIYGKEEMMVSKFNLIKNLPNNHKYYLQDRFKNKYPINVNNNIMTIFNNKEKNMTDLNKYYDMGINYLRYEILDENDI